MATTTNSKDGDKKIQIVFFPQLVGGHFVPMIDTARILAAHGVRAVIATTPYNASLYQATIDRDRAAGRDICFRTLQLPLGEFGLPEGCENQLAITSLDMSAKLFMAIMKLEEPLERLLLDLRPDCLISDFFHPWSLAVAERLGIPRICFEVSSVFSACAEESMRRYNPHLSVESDSEPFLLPGLPDKITQTKLTLPEWAQIDTGFKKWLDLVLDAELKSHGFIFNSYYDLEQTYIDLFHGEMKRNKAWYIGPVSLFNRDPEDMKNRGSKATVDEHSVLSWLDSKQPKSVFYVTFGSFPRIAPEQIYETASGLEASGHNFVWVLGKMVDGGEGYDQKKWFPDGFEERIREKGTGFLIRGWAPQLLILQHPAIGGSICHGGWNSLMEAVSNGLPVITWPLTSEQFYNEKFVLDVLKIGIPVGNEEWVSWHKPRMTVRREKVERALRRLMGGGEEVEEMRRRSAEYGENARKAVAEGGSSYRDVDALIEEIKSIRDSKKTGQSNGLKKQAAAAAVNGVAASY